MPIAPSCPTLVQPFPAPLPAPLPMRAASFPDLRHTRATVSCNKLFSTVAQYGRATAPNDKALEGRNMTLFEMETEYYGPTMVACKCQLTVFALWTAADPEEPRWNRPWDPGGPGRTRNTLRTRFCLMGSRMIQLILGGLQEARATRPTRKSVPPTLCAKWLGGAKRANKICCRELVP
ncbi:hypothetical protein JHK82_040252 [Glycine max]|nr:hypothetical protein JHK86_040445 [Glycine max]KAG5111029.1 hypothetical protein JHK82_040252 [Glycine max]